MLHVIVNVYKPLPKGQRSSGPLEGLPDELQTKITKQVPCWWRINTSQTDLSLPGNPKLLSTVNNGLSLFNRALVNTH